MKYTREQETKMNIFNDEDAAINFKKVDVKKPINEPNAAFKALLESLLSFIISPK